LLIRPDLDRAYYAFRGLGRDADVEVPKAPMPSMYTYMGVKPCRTDRECHQFSIVDPLSTMEYSTFSFFKEDMSLESEYYYFPSVNYSMKFEYEYIEEYIHDEVDNEFSLTRWGDESPAATPAIWAVSTGCNMPPSPSSQGSSSKSSSVPTPPSSSVPTPPSSSIPAPSSSSIPTPPSSSMKSSVHSSGAVSSSVKSSAPASAPSSSDPSLLFNNVSLAAVHIPSFILIAFFAIIFHFF